ncbi:MAG: bifunctional adenosylcobinamide kinase/adenosylcobinamide-phosphate guanylyltransferase [Agathobaculum sp.]|uniref:bifunctional adenosylcobinamide kinase/adenosylcobinamide-phosphate guanylyltransferase n=1 Tax=Agathobaculum sp. TaxID=2048138 RepID=UPI0025BB220A|nr:bifunctional adenosylcobinamide kinase/adenosylcobinamide-phosphate guanylyltransferase [Agathobaculum sp.]MCI7125070.1 bifunctional adenosylcobinamide kinase/adenosylcobinamide-phosphate guanylyltransferase [Agathobaculum sp.]MDY3710864.1 bifunctional adenosylcobinamide kinase/adenosylcobinamide-phosphate guanylyltransferase [Agathobaculum sp.]
MLILVTGGAASGKSAHAERLLCARAVGARLYLATMAPQGAAAQRRIRRHRALRAGKGFVTLERSCGLDGLHLPRRYDGILLEDMGNLLANELYAPQAAGQTALDSILAGIKRLQACCETLVIVTNEVFSDGLPYADETVCYIALLGRLNTELAAQADAVYESVCGLLLPVKEGKNR